MEPGNDQQIRDNLKGIKLCRVVTVSYALTVHLKFQVNYLKDLGMNIFLISSDGPELNDLGICDTIRHEVVEIPRSLKPVTDITVFIKLAKIFRKYKFDIVHSITPKAGLLTSVAAFMAGVPIRLHTFTGQPWVNLKPPLRWFAQYADKLIGFLNTKCYADSDSQRRFLIDNRIISSEKIGVVGAGSISGVDLDRFDSGKFDLPEKNQLKRKLSISLSAKIITFIGRIAKDKGIRELISAFNELLKLGYDTELLLVGPLDKDCGGNGDFNVTPMRECSKIHYIGYTASPEKYLAISDIFCLPSYREGFGSVVIEAAAMGIPTVGTNIYGLVDAVVDGETGILVPSGNDRALIDALKHLLDNPEKLQMMGKAARQRCLQYFDANIINKKVAEEYASILKAPKRFEARIHGGYGQ